MEQKKINRKALTVGVVRALSDQRVDTRKKIAERVLEGMELDERIITLRALIKEYPFLKREFEDSIAELKDKAADLATSKLPTSWVSCDEKSKIRGRLELMTDDEIRRYTLEELASLLKDM